MEKEFKNIFLLDNLVKGKTLSNSDIFQPGSLRKLDVCMSKFIFLSSFISNNFSHSLFRILNLPTLIYMFSLHDPCIFEPL